MSTTLLLSRFALALGIGLAVGLERGWRTRAERPGGRTAGIRTFTVSALLGAVLGALAQAMGHDDNAGGVGGVAGGLVLGLGLAGYAVMIGQFFRDENRAEGQFSATSAVAALVTVALGAFAVIGEPRLTAAAGVAMMAVLALRERLHGWVAAISAKELRSVIILLAMTFIVLPVTPDRPVGPLGGVNLHEVWLIAILLAAVSFMGYVATRLLGETMGQLAAGAAGGLTSSTAVTVINARRAAAGQGAPLVLAAGVAMASAVMFLRVTGIVAVFNAALLPVAAPALIACALVSLIYAGVTVHLRAARSHDGLPDGLHNPFDLRVVLGSAVLLAVVIVAARAIEAHFGASGVILGAAVAGVVDMDALTVAMSRSASLAPFDAATAILVGVGASSIGKIGIGMALGRGRFAAEIGVMTLVSLLAGAAAWWAMGG